MLIREACDLVSGRLRCTGSLCQRLLTTEVPPYSDVPTTEVSPLQRCPHYQCPHSEQGSELCSQLVNVWLVRSRQNNVFGLINLFNSEPNQAGHV